MENYNSKLGARIKKIRETIGLSQGFISKGLEIDRSSISQIETGKRKVSAEELAGLARIFNISSDVLLGFESEIEVILEKSKAKKKKKKELRISIPQRNLVKFKEVLLYILEKVGSKENIGEAVLLKILYFIDFDFYEKYEEQLIGATYIKNHYGPTPKEFLKVIKEMEGNEVEKINIIYYKYAQTKYLPKRKPDLTKLRAHETKLIDDVLAKLSDMSAKEISQYSHGDVPWQVTEPGEIIDYESVFYRTAPYSVRTYDED